jgi:hypothetical protein
MGANEPNLRGFTIEDQIAMLPKLRTRSEIARVFGYASFESLKTRRRRGKLIPSQRLLYASRLFEDLAVQLRSMANVVPSSRKRFIPPDQIAELGLLMGDAGEDRKG